MDALPHSYADAPFGSSPPPLMLTAPLSPAPSLPGPRHQREHPKALCSLPILTIPFPSHFLC
jgi:hypothetical protein